MPFKIWLIFAGIFTIATLVHEIGERTLFTATDSSGFSDALTVNTEQISQGGGFVAIPSLAFGVVGQVFKWVSFNYNFLQGDLEIVRWILVATFGTAFLILVVLTFVGALQRQLG